MISMMNKMGIKKHVHAHSWTGPLIHEFIACALESNERKHCLISFFN